MEIVNLINGGYDIQVQEYFERAQPPVSIARIPAFGYLADEKIVGICFYEKDEETKRIIKNIQLYIHVEEDYRGRILTPTNSALVASFEYFNSLRNTDEFKEYRGAQCWVMNEEVSVEVMERLGFKQFATKGTMRYFERIFDAD
jgi:hypothetical protein